MLELIICGITLGVCIGIGCGATFFGCIYLADWFENRSKRRKVAHDSREAILQMQRAGQWQEEPR